MRSPSRRRFLQGTAASTLGFAGYVAPGDPPSTRAGRERDDGARTSPAVSEQEPSGEVRLLHDTHFHGRFGEPDAAENIANYVGLVQRVAGNDARALRLGNGDDLASSVLSSVFDGEHMVDALNAGGLDYDTYGNHDFDMGPATLRERVAGSEFTWTSANALDERTGEVFAAEQGAKRYALTTVGDVTVGITGIINEQAPEITSIGENTRIQAPADALHEVVPRMREDGAHAVVVLSHVASPVAEELAAEVSGVDAIVGDHAAAVFEQPKVIDGTIVSAVGDGFEFLGELTLDVEQGAVQGFEFTLHETAAAVETESFQPSQPVEAVVDSYLSRLDEQLGVVVGESTVPLDARTDVVRSRESNLGNFIADTLRKNTDADVALMNGGGIRSDTRYPTGRITKKEIVNVLPFPNNSVELEVTGKTLLAALENGVSEVGEGAGRFPQVSELSYTYDPTRPVGDRIVAATTGGEPIDPDASYTLATNDFVADGGDGYEGLADATVLTPANEGGLLSTLVADRIQRLGTIAPETEGRITIDRDSDTEQGDEVDGAADPAAVFYQVDFVTGEPIEDLRGPEGYYTPDRLIRFLHGSTEEPVRRRSAGEFIADESMAERIESDAIAVEDGTATITFTVAEGESVTLTLASYEKAGPGWSPETEAEQAFIDSETRTVESGTYTFTVDLPDANGSSNAERRPTPLAR